MKPSLFSYDTCLDVLLGVAIGDALGVPVEFKSREEISKTRLQI